jgi:DNA polymerase-3 subunit alpha
MVKGRISLREEEDPKIILSDASPLTHNPKQKLYLKISKDRDPALQEEILAVLKKYQGNVHVILYMEATKARMMANQEYWVEGREALLDELYRMLGSQCVKMVD